MGNLYPVWIIQLFLGLYTNVSSTYESILFIFNKVSNAFNSLFKPQYYIFLKDSVYPHPFEIDQESRHNMAAPDLYYNADERLFFPWDPVSPINTIVNNSRKSIPILSLELLSDDGTVKYDLTDFIESMRQIIIPGKSVPSIGQIISVWQLWSRVLLDPSRTNARYIDADGNVVETFVRSNESVEMPS
jgi:hypothetical protein